LEISHFVTVKEISIALVNLKRTKSFVYNETDNPDDTVICNFYYTAFAKN